MNVDVCIIGAGPAGLTAAIFAARTGARVILVERGTVAGRKLLKTGRGRCNLTHTGTIEEFIKAYGPCGRFLKPALYEFPPQAVREFFHVHRLATKEEKDGCVFPITDRATDVCRILVDRARRLNVEFHYGRRVETIEKTEDEFYVKTDKQTIRSPAVIVATGGMSWSYTGSTGDGYRLAETFGHTIIPPKAALCPLITVDNWPSDMQGRGLEDVEIRTSLNKKRISMRGPIMFTTSGIGGPAVFNFSRLITDTVADKTDLIKVTVDFYPSATRAELEQWLIDQCNAHPKMELAGVLSSRIQRRLSIKLQDFVFDGRPVLAGQCTRPQRKQLLDLLKSMTMTVKKLESVDKATITRGGVSRQEIESKTMQSRKCPGLFFAGEVIDADGPCGGYNLQIAWSTGALAGNAAASFITKK